MCGCRRRIGRPFRQQAAGIARAILFAFVLALSASAPVLAAGDSMRDILPSPGFAPGWAMREPVALHDPDTLFDHINGEAELYFPYGFGMLATAAYANEKAPDVWVVVDVYRMGSVLDAFGIYSNYRKANAAETRIGAEGFVSSSQLMFYQDRYFVRIQVTGAASVEQGLLTACGRAVSRNLPSPASRPGELEVLAGVPGVVAKSERYIGQSLLGYAFFRRGIIADAMLGGERVQVFVVLEGSPDAARKAFDAYRSYLKAEGREMSVTGTDDRVFLTAADPLYGGVFVEQSGSSLAGVIRMREAASAKAVVEQLRERLLKRQGRDRPSLLMFDENHS